jgi:hypothetical protein
MIVRKTPRVGEHQRVADAIAAGVKTLIWRLSTGRADLRKRGALPIDPLLTQLRTTTQIFLKTNRLIALFYFPPFYRLLRDP